MNKEEDMETQLEEAGQQPDEQPLITDHVPPTAGQFCVLCR